MTKPLPYSAESERAVLGAMLLDPSLVALVRRRLSAEDFFEVRNQVLFAAFLSIEDAGGTPDHLTLTAHLEQSGQASLVGGVVYLATLDLDLPDIGRVVEYAEIVKDRAVRRALVAAAQRTIRGAVATAAPVSELLAQMGTAASGLLDQAVPVQWELASVAVNSVLEAAEQDNAEALQGLKTGFEDWDRLGPGLLRGSLIIIAGRPGMGKTSLLLDVVRHLALEQHKAVGVFSLEQQKAELGLKLLTAEADVAARYLRASHVSSRQWTELFNATRRIGGARLFLDDTGGLQLRDLEARAWRLKAEHPDLALLGVDYLQLVEAGISDKRLEVELITRRLKKLAKDLCIPVVALSQLNRESTRRADPRPNLGDLAESGAIEANADHVAFVHRQEMYTPDDDSVRGLAEILVRKYRQGETGTAVLVWDGPTSSFHNRAVEPPPATGPDPF